MMTVEQLTRIELEAFMCGDDRTRALIEEIRALRTQHDADAARIKDLEADVRRGRDAIDL